MNSSFLPPALDVKQKECREFFRVDSQKCCPITKQSFYMPCVLSSDGNTYEEAALRQRIEEARKNVLTDTSEPATLRIIPNWTFRGGGTPHDWITQEPFRDPYICAQDGFTYDFSSFCKRALTAVQDAAKNKRFITHIRGRYTSHEHFEFYPNRILWPTSEAQPPSTAEANVVSIPNLMTKEFDQLKRGAPVFDEKIRSLVDAWGTSSFQEKQTWKEAIHARRRELGLEVRSDAEEYGVDLSDLNLSRMNIGCLQAKRTVFWNVDFSDSTIRFDLNDLQYKMDHLDTQFNHCLFNRAELIDYNPRTTCIGTSFDGATFKQSQTEGDFKTGRRTGKRIYVFPNGDKYEGDLVDGKPHGKGTFTWPNGHKYEGDFVNGRRTGKGIYDFPDGDKYEGDFVDGKVYGKGTFTWPGGARYVGDFVNGRRTGKGIYDFPNGDKYEGDFFGGKRHGKGTFTWSNGHKYEGLFINNQGSGRGTYIWSDGKKYEGKFFEGSSPDDKTVQSSAVDMIGWFRGIHEPVIGWRDYSSPLLSKKHPSNCPDPIESEKARARSVLGVDASADDATMRRRYRELALQFHPDKNLGREQQFRTIQAAYECLSRGASRERPVLRMEDYADFDAFLADVRTAMKGLESKVSLLSDDQQRTEWHNLYQELSAITPTTDDKLLQWRFQILRKQCYGKAEALQVKSLLAEKNKKFNEFCRMQSLDRPLSELPELCSQILTVYSDLDANKWDASSEEFRKTLLTLIDHMLGYSRSLAEGGILMNDLVLANKARKTAILFYQKSYARMNALIANAIMDQSAHSSKRKGSDQVSFPRQSEERPQQEHKESSPLMRNIKKNLAFFGLEESDD